MLPRVYNASGDCATDARAIDWRPGPARDAANEPTPLSRSARISSCHAHGASTRRLASVRCSPASSTALSRRARWATSRPRS
eukprot:1803420-Pyramimonas_sp.AAC.1